MAVAAVAAARPRLRAAELLCLILAAGVALAAPLPLLLADGRGVSPAELWQPLVLVSCFLLLHGALSARGSRADPVIGPAVLTLMGLSLTLNQRLAPALDERQFAWLVIGALVLVLTSVAPVPLHFLRRYPYSWAMAGAGLVLATLLFGRGVGPGTPRLWLGLGPLQFQPSEVLKLVLVLFLAAYLAEKGDLLAQASTRIGPVRLPPLPYLAPLAVMLGGSLVLLAAQRDLGAALLLYSTGLGMLYLSSGRVRYVAAGMALFVATAWFFQGTLDIVRVRAAVWLDPWADSSGAGYQLVQALMAIGAGGIMGTGVGQGLPTAIPAVHTDFVYAAIVEEMGLAGATGVLAIYGGLFLRGWRIAARAPSRYLQLLAAGLTLSLSVQTLVIVGGILRAFPLTGITLPFLSFGGTSLVTSSVAVGLLLRISEVSRRRPAAGMGTT